MSIIVKNFYNQPNGYLVGFSKIELLNILDDCNKYEILSITILAIVCITTTTDEYLILTTIATITGMFNLLCSS